MKTDTNLFSNILRFFLIFTQHINKRKKSVAHLKRYHTSETEIIKKGSGGHL